jgi:hypothetical protein
MASVTTRFTGFFKLQLIAVLKVQIEKLVFQAFFDSHNRFAHTKVPKIRVVPSFFVRSSRCVNPLLVL